MSGWRAKFETGAISQRSPPKFGVIVMSELQLVWDRRDLTTDSIMFRVNVRWLFSV